MVMSILTAAPQALPCNPLFLKLFLRTPSPSVGRACFFFPMPSNDHSFFSDPLSGRHHAWRWEVEETPGRFSRRSFSPLDHPAVSTTANQRWLAFAESLADALDEGQNLGPAFPRGQTGAV